MRRYLVARLGGRLPGERRAGTAAGAVSRVWGWHETSPLQKCCYFWKHLIWGSASFQSLCKPLSLQWGVLPRAGISSWFCCVDRKSGETVCSGGDGLPQPLDQSVRRGAVTVCCSNKLLNTVWVFCSGKSVPAPQGWTLAPVWGWLALLNIEVGSAMHFWGCGSCWASNCLLWVHRLPAVLGGPMWGAAQHPPSNLSVLGTFRGASGNLACSGLVMAWNTY